MKIFPRFSLNFARDKDLPADFDFFFSFFILVSILFQYSSFSLVSKSTNIFRLFHHNRCNPYRKSIKMIFSDVFRESIMWLSGEFLHEWLFTRDSIVWIRLSWKKWPAELRYVATSRGNTNNADLFPSQGRNIWNKYFIPALYQSPAFEKGFTADNRQNSSARTDDARLILKKDSESA